MWQLQENNTQTHNSGWKGLAGLQSNLLLKSQSILISDQVTHGSAWSSFKNIQGWRLHRLCGQPIHITDCLYQIVPQFGTDPESDLGFKSLYNTITTFRWIYPEGMFKLSGKTEIHLPPCSFISSYPLQNIVVGNYVNCKILMSGKNNMTQITVCGAILPPGRSNILFKMFSLEEEHERAADFTISLRHPS